MQMLNDAAVIGEHFTERMAKMCYCESGMNVIDEFVNRQKLLCLLVRLHAHARQ